MFCGNCGKELPEDSIFCPFCGTKVDMYDIEQPRSEQARPQGIKPANNIGEQASAHKSGGSSSSYLKISPILIGIIGVVLLIGIVAAVSNGGGTAEPLSGKYTVNNLGLTISGYEFFPDGSVTYYCAGFENSHGTYTAKGNKYVLTIDDVGQDSYYVSFMEELRDKCTITATPVDENTIDVEIKAKASDEIYLGQFGKVQYTKEGY